MDNSLLQKVYAASDSGLDIIKSVCPEVVNRKNTKKAFTVRCDDDNASSHLYPPDHISSYWHVKDYGGEWLSPIDLFNVSSTKSD